MYMKSGILGFLLVAVLLVGCSAEDSFLENIEEIIDNSDANELSNLAYQVLMIILKQLHILQF